MFAFRKFRVMTTIAYSSRGDAETRRTNRLGKCFADDSSSCFFDVLHSTSSGVSSFKTKFRNFSFVRSTATSRAVLRASASPRENICTRLLAEHRHPARSFSPEIASWPFNTGSVGSTIRHSRPPRPSRLRVKLVSPIQYATALPELHSAVCFAARRNNAAQ